MHTNYEGKKNWASEVSPTLSCSIEISRDMYNTNTERELFCGAYCMSVCRFVYDCLHTKKNCMLNCVAERYSPNTRML